MLENRIHFTVCQDELRLNYISNSVDAEIFGGQKLWAKWMLFLQAFFMNVALFQLMKLCQKIIKETYFYGVLRFIMRKNSSSKQNNTNYFESRRVVTSRIQITASTECCWLWIRRKRESVWKQQISWSRCFQIRGPDKLIYSGLLKMKS